MNASPLTELFATFASASWRASWLILLLIGVRVVVRGRIPAGVWFFAWIVVALRLLLPFSVPAGWSPYNLTARSAPAIEPIAPITAPVPVRLETIAPNPILSEPASAPVSEIAAVSAVVAPPRWSTPAVLALVWLAGAAGLMVLRGAAAWQFRRRLHGACEADARVRTITRREADAWRIARELRCVETTAVDAPALYGLTRPWLLLPPGFAAQLNDDELRLVIRHELAHWRRRDLAAQALLQLAVALHWFNPLAWIAARLARTDCELACDEYVLRRETDGDTTAYGSTLLKVLGVTRGRRRPATVIAILEGRQQLAHRVRMIANYRGSTMGRVIGGALLLVVLTVASMTRESHAQPAPQASQPAPATPTPAAVEPSALVAESAAAPSIDRDRDQRDRNQRQVRAVEMLAATVDEQRKKVDTLAQQLQHFKETHKISSLDQRKDAVNESLKASNLEAQRAYIQLETAKSRVAQIQDARKRGAELTALSFVAGQPLVIELQQQLSKQRIAVVSLNERYREAHPNMVAANNALLQTQRELERAIKAACDQVEAEFRAAEQIHLARQLDLERSKTASLELDRVALGYHQIEREFTTQNQILQSVVARAREDMLLDRRSKATPSQAAEPDTAGGATRPKAEPLSVILQKRPNGWVIAETRGDQDELAKSADQIQALKANLESPPAKVVSTPEADRLPDSDSFTVSVVGAVNAQGAVTLREGHKPLALDAIARAGGFAPNANRTAVRLLRAGDDGARATIVLSETALMAGGGLLEPRDVIIVPLVATPVPQYATVVGAVNRAGRIGLTPGRPTTIVDVLSLAGGHSRLADLKRVRLTRQDPSARTSTVTIIDVDAILKGAKTADTAPSIAPDDTIVVPERIL